MRPTDATLPLVVAGVLLVVVLALLVAAGVTDPFDQPIIQAVRDPALHALLSPLGVITELGSTWGVTAVALVVLVVGVVAGPWLHGLAGALTIALASIGNTLFKALIARARPDLLEPIVVEHGFSFPSGHAALSAVAYGVLSVLVLRSPIRATWQRVVVATAVVVVFLVGVSRIWLGVHYPTDVLAGWTAGGVIVLLFARLTRTVSTEPVGATAGEDRAAPRSGRPESG